MATPWLAVSASRAMLTYPLRSLSPRRSESNGKDKQTQEWELDGIQDESNWEGRQFNMELEWPSHRAAVGD